MREGAIRTWSSEQDLHISSGRLSLSSLSLVTCGWPGRGSCGSLEVAGKKNLHRCPGYSMLEDDRKGNHGKVIRLILN